VAEERIVGGTTDTGDPAVVMLYFVAGSSTALCTGTVVSPHVVITAAHCVSSAEFGVTPTVSVFLGNDLSKATAADLLPTVTTSFDAQFSINNLQGGHDIGVVVAKNPLPVTPRLMNRQALSASQVGGPVRLVGHGITMANATDYGLKRQTTTALSAFNSLLLQFADPLHNTCNGDSGGPAFMTPGRHRADRRRHLVRGRHLSVERVRYPARLLHRLRRPLPAQVRSARPQQ
jgi:secreted trypsin-like serine protease